MRTALLVFCCAAAAAVPADSTPPRPWSLAARPIPSPAAAMNSAQPQLMASDRGVVLSWIERDGPRSTLKFAERTASGWTAPRRVVAGNDLFVNWADVPSVMRMANGTLAAHWLQKNGAGTYAYDVRLSRSADDGRTWTDATVPHSDGTQTEHGFASLFDLPEGGLGLVWLDGRKMVGGGGHGAGEMSLRFGAFDARWTQTAETEVDPRVCECCPTAAAVTSDGPIVAFRNRSPDEIRDIVVSRLENGRWTEPRAVHPDAWQVHACPVNGPALSARGKDVLLAWFTGKHDQPRAYAAFSRDAGRTFGAPIRLDDGVSLGRVDVELLSDGSGLASYIEYTGRKPRFMIRRIEPTGSRSEAVTIAGLEDGRTSGYPRVARHGRELVFAWVERGDGGTRVRTAVAHVEP